MTRDNERCEVISSDQVPVGFAVFVTRDGMSLFGPIVGFLPEVKNDPVRIYLHPDDFADLQNFKNARWQ